jgi:hypothetical protein
MLRIGGVADLPPGLTTAKAAELYGVGVDHLWALVRTGEAPVEPLRLGRKLVWPTALVLRSLGIEPAVESEDTADVMPIMRQEPAG